MFFSAMSNQPIFGCDTDKIIQAKQCIESDIIYISSFFSTPITALSY
jgi:hypothetical protein